jgi:hypothetical protein
MAKEKALHELEIAILASLRAQQLHGVDAIRIPSGAKD